MYSNCYCSEDKYMYHTIHYNLSCSKITHVLMLRIKFHDIEHLLSVKSTITLLTCSVKLHQIKITKDHLKNGPQLLGYRLNNCH